MRIGEVASRLGTTTSAIRFYERRGLIGPGRRTAAGYRDYDDETLARLTFIARAKDVGFSLAEIRALLETDAEPSRATESLLATKLLEIGSQLRNLKLVETRLRSLRSRLKGRTTRRAGALRRLLLSPEGDVMNVPSWSTPPMSSGLMNASQEEAQHLGHPWIGAEHILLALMKRPHARALLRRRGFGIAKARASVVAAVGKGEGHPTSQTFTPRAHTIFGVAHGIAVGEDRLPNDVDLLLGILESGDSVATAVLQSHGIDVRSLRIRLRSRASSPTPPRASRRDRGIA